MATDIALVVAAAFIFYFFWKSLPINVAIFSSVVLFFLFAIMYKSWKKSGGLIAWKSRNAGD